METRLRYLLQERGMTKAEFARQMHIIPQNVNAIMKDRASMVTLIASARVLRVPIWELFYDCGYSCVGIELNEWSENPTNRIKYIMSSKKISQKDLADKIGVTQSSVCLTIKNGSYKLSTLEAFAKGLDVPIWELFVTPDGMRREIERRKTLLDGGTWVSQELNPALLDHEPTSLQENKETDDLFDTIADDAEEREMISVAESKRRMRKALQLLLDNLGRIRPETLDRIVEQACR